MNIENTFTEIKLKADFIQKQNGIAGLAKAGFSYITGFFYKRETFQLSEKLLIPPATTSQSLSVLNEKVFDFRIVTSNQEADILEAEGLRFRTYPTEFNYNLKRYKWLLDHGVIAFCTFIEKEFAAICWVIVSRDTHNAVKALPLKISYENNEAMPRGMWVNPKFRRLGLFTYTARNRDIYLLKKGITRIRGTIDNDIGKHVIIALGETYYGNAQWIKILWWKFWKEYHFTPK